MSFTEETDVLTAKDLRPELEIECMGVGWQEIRNVTQTDDGVRLALSGSYYLHLRSDDEVNVRGYLCCGEF